MTETADYSYSFEDDDEIRIDGEIYEYVGGYREGHTFKRPGQRHPRFLTHEEIVEWTRSERITVEKRRKPLSRRRMAAAGNEIELGRLPKDEADHLQYKFELTGLWRQARSELPHGHTTQGGKDALPLAYSRWLDLRTSQIKGKKAAPIYKMVGYSTICSYDARLRKRSGSVMDLRDERHMYSGNFFPWLHHKVELVLQEAIHHYLHAGEPISQSYCYKHFLTPKVFALKVRMLAAGEEGRFETPSLTTFKARLSQVDEFHQIACRYSRDEAERRLRSKGEGLQIVRPGGRAEVDGWTIHLHTVLEDTDVWGNLSPKQIAAIKTVRVVVVVILDRATRSITGVHFSWSENKESMIAAIRLAVKDKTDIAEAYGCDSKWPQRSTGNIVGDLAGAFAADETARVILNSLGAQQFTIPSKPWLKGAIESFFKRCAHDFVQAFLGIAWSDPAKRDTTRAIIKANVNLKELREKFIRWVVDDYHRAYLPELGTTPLAAWYKQSIKFPPRPEMSKAKESTVFSRVINNVALSGAGVRVVGNDYTSRELQRLFEVTGHTFVDVAVDDEDLGRVSVCIPKDIDPKRVGLFGEDASRWIIALGPEELQGVSSWQMSFADEQLLIQYGADDATSERVRNTAREELLASQIEGRKRTVYDHGPGPDILDRYRNGFHPGLRFASRDELKETLDLDLNEIHAPIQTGSARAVAATAVHAGSSTPDGSSDQNTDVRGDGEVGEEIQIRFASDEGNS